MIAGMTILVYADKFQIQILIIRSSLGLKNRIQKSVHHFGAEI